MRLHLVGHRQQLSTVWDPSLGCKGFERGRSNLIWIAAQDVQLAAFGLNQVGDEQEAASGPVAYLKRAARVA